MLQPSYEGGKNDTFPAFTPQVISANSTEFRSYIIRLLLYAARVRGLKDSSESFEWKFWPLVKLMRFLSEEYYRVLLQLKSVRHLPRS